MTLRLLCCGLLLCCSLVYASVAEVSLRDLHDNSLQPLGSDQPQLLMFFAPDCRWCEKQMQQMSQLQSQCGAVRQAVIGIHGSRSALRSELKQQHIHLNAYLSDKRFIRQIGGVPATPYTLVVGADHNIMAMLRGYIEAERLAAITAALSENSCSLQELL